MVTLVGTRDDFVTDLKELLELDYDAVEAYNEAINRLDNSEYKEKLKEFRDDHKSHIRNISKLLEQHNQETPKGTDMLKSKLTKGKVIIADLMGDKTILKAMSSNEEDTNTAYDRMSHHAKIWDDAKEILENGLKDERKHQEWLESKIK